MLLRRWPVIFNVGSSLDSDALAYYNRSGMDRSKLTQFNSLVLYLKAQGFWDNIKHFYIGVKGFNAGAGSIIHDVIADVSGGEDLSVTGYDWPTLEGASLSRNTNGAISSSVALIPTAGDNTVIFSFPNLRFIDTTSERLWRQGATNIYGPVFLYDVDPTQQTIQFSAGDAGGHLFDDSFRGENWTSAFFAQMYWKHHPIAVVLDRTSGRLYAYGNRDLCSMLGSSPGANDGVAVTPTIENAIFEMGFGVDYTRFDFEYLLILDTAISGAEYQKITYQIERTLAPRNPELVNSGLIWLDANYNDLWMDSPGMYYDSTTDKYYRYVGSGRYYSGSPPNESQRGIYSGVYVYSSDSLNGPWTLGGLAYNPNNSNLLTALGDISAEDALVIRPSVIYHTARDKYILGAKARTELEGNSLLLLAEADDPIGPFITSYVGLINSEPAGDSVLFKDGDGTAYVVYRNPSAEQLKISALTSDYDGPTGTSQTIIASKEAPAIVKIGSRYWLIASDVLGWTPTSHVALYSDAGNPLSGWTDAGNPFDSNDEAYEQSFMSQSYGLFMSRNGDVIYNGNRNIPFYYDPFGRRNTASRPVMLPVTISGTTMTISWDPHWDPSAYE